MRSIYRNFFARLALICLAALLFTACARNTSIAIDQPEPLDSLGELYLSWTWQLSELSSIESKRLIISNEDNQERIVFPFPSLIGGELLRLPAGRYRFFALLDDRHHPIDLRNILPHTFRIQTNKTSIIGTLEFADQANSVRIHQSSYLRTSEAVLLSTKENVSGYSLRPLSDELVKLNQDINCTGVHCPDSQIRECLITEASRQPVQYGYFLLTLRWVNNAYQLELTPPLVQSSHSEELLNCLEQQVDRLDQPIYGELWRFEL